MNLGNRAIVIVDRDYFPLLYRFRADHPEIFFRLLTPEDVRSRLGINFASSPIPSLLRCGLDYDSAKKWMRILGYGAHESNPQAKAYFEAIPEELIQTDPLGVYELSNADLYLLELSEDIQTRNLLSRHGLSAKDISLLDLGIEPVTDLNHLEVTLFQNKYEQFDAVFSLLRQRYLLKQKEKGIVKADDVRLFVQDEADAFYLSLMGKEFGIPVQAEVSSPAYAEPGVSALCDAFHARQSLSLTQEEQETESGKLLADTIAEFGLSDLPFESGYLSLFEILHARKVRHTLSENGVIASSSCVFSPEKEIFLTCLQHGLFYNVYSDDDVLSDEALLALGLNPSYVKTQLERRKKRNYLAYHRFALLSRVKQHLDEKIHPSGFAEEYGWKKVAPSFTGTYHSLSSKNRVMTEIDRVFYTKPIGEYRGYDSSFKGIEGYRYGKSSFSITALKNYRHCPYQFYLNTVLPPAKNDSRSRLVGVMVHRALENIYARDYDMEEALAQSKITYFAEREKLQIDPSPFDEVLVEATKVSLRRLLPLVESQKNVATISEQWSEEWFDFTLQDEKGQYPFRGAIDNILRFEAGSAHYLVINDYKSGNERFHPYECFLGASTQLPLYYYALTQGKQSRYPKSEPLLQRFPSVFAGMGIKPVAFKSLLTLFKDGVMLHLDVGYKSLASSGAFTNDPGFWTASDPTYKATNTSTNGRYFLAGKTTFAPDGTGNLSGLPNGKPYCLEELINDAIQGTLDVIHAILDGDFPIAPASSDLREVPTPRNIACTYCPYRDICYRNLARDAKDYSKAIKEKFEEGGHSHGIQ